MIRVEFNEEVVFGGLTYYKGDIKTMEPSDAEVIINAGWGRNADTGECGERSTSPIELEVHNARTVLCSG